MEKTLVNPDSCHHFTAVNCRFQVYSRYSPKAHKRINGSMRKDETGRQGTDLMNRRRSKRAPARVPFDLYCRARRLGRFWTSNLSQEGLFLHTGAIERLDAAILDLRFRANGAEYRLRGIVVHQIQGQGIGIQLAYWRTGDRPAHAAYLQLTKPSRLCQAA